MNLQIQLRRGLIALVIGLMLGGVAVARASLDGGASEQGVGAVVQAVDKDAGCGSSLRIEVAKSVHVNVPCELSCAPMRSVLHTLHVAATRELRCPLVHTA